MLAFLRGPLRYEERLVGHDAALRALTRWRVWLYDCLSPRVPAALAGWRSGDLLARAIDDVDALQDLYLRTLLPVAIAVGAGVIGTVAVGLILPWAALALGIPLALALAVPALLTWRRSGDDELAALSGTLSAQVVDALAGAPELLAFGADDAVLGAVEALGARSDALERHHARVATASALVIALCLAAAVTGVLALGVAAVHAHHLGQVMVAVLPLAVLATFETVPGVPLAVARALAVRASADRLFALEEVPVPVRDPDAPDRTGARRARGGLRGRGPALRAGPAPRPRRRQPPGAPRRPGRRHRLERRRQVEPRHRAPALLAPRGRHARRWRAPTWSASPRHDARAACALADQRAQMFAGTLRSNLTLARPDAGEDEVAAALRAARLDAFVDALPEGLDTPVGEDGVALSGGERRRVAVARALLAPGPGGDPRRAHQRPRPRAGRRAHGRRARRGRGAQRAGDHAPGRRGGALRHDRRPRGGARRARLQP